ncbi:MAG: hypothetical protein QNJ97_18820 [Myxococcota bacterium]|nr:hypothetical protein [Myxococcota bacterium]
MKRKHIILFAVAAGCSLAIIAGVTWIHTGPVDHNRAIPTSLTNRQPVKRSGPPTVGRQFSALPSSTDDRGLQSTRLSQWSGPSSRTGLHREFLKARAKLQVIRAELAEATDPKEINRLKRNERVVSAMVERFRQGEP